jgi:hypothetical protein
VCSPAFAKFRISIAASDLTPVVRERVTLVVRSERALDWNLRLIAVAPGWAAFRVVATITGDTTHPDPNGVQFASLTRAAGALSFRTAPPSE